MRSKISLILILILLATQIVILIPRASAGTASSIKVTLLKRLIPNNLAPGMWPGIFHNGAYYVIYNNFTWHLRVSGGALNGYNIFIDKINGTPSVTIKMFNLTTYEVKTITINNAWIPTFALYGSDFNSQGIRLITAGKNFIAFATAGALIIVSPTLDKVVVLRGFAPYRPPEVGKKPITFHPDEPPRILAGASEDLVIVAWDNITSTINYYYTIMALKRKYNVYVINATSLLSSASNITEESFPPSSIEYKLEMAHWTWWDTKMVMLQGNEIATLVISGKINYKDKLVWGTWGITDTNFEPSTIVVGVDNNGTFTYNMSSKCNCIRLGYIEYATICGNYKFTANGAENNSLSGNIIIDDVSAEIHYSYWHSYTKISRGNITVTVAGAPAYMEYKFPYGLLTLSSGEVLFYVTNSSNIEPYSLALNYREFKLGLDNFMTYHLWYAPSAGPLQPGGYGIDWIRMNVIQAHLHYPYVAVGGFVYALGVADPEGERELRIVGNIVFNKSVTDGEEIPLVFDRDPLHLPNIYGVNVTVTVNRAVRVRGYGPIVYPGIVQAIYSSGFESKTVLGTTVGVGRAVWSIHTPQELLEKKYQLASGLSGVAGSFTLNAEWIGNEIIGGQYVPVAAVGVFMFDTQPTPIRPGMNIEYQLPHANVHSTFAGEILTGDVIHALTAVIGYYGLKTALRESVTGSSYYFELIETRLKDFLDTNAVEDVWGGIVAMAGVRSAVLSAVSDTGDKTVMQRPVLGLTREADIRVSGLSDVAKQLARNGVKLRDSEDVVKAAVRRAVSLYIHPEKVYLTPQQVAGTFANGVEKIGELARNGKSLTLQNGVTISSADLQYIYNAIKDKANGDVYGYARSKVKGQVPLDYLPLVYTALLIPATKDYVVHTASGAQLKAKLGERAAYTLVADILARVILLSNDYTQLGIKKPNPNVSSTLHQLFRSSLAAELAAKGYNPGLAGKVDLTKVTVTVKYTSDTITREFRFENNWLTSVFPDFAGMVLDWSAALTKSPLLIAVGAAYTSMMVSATVLRMVSMIALGPNGYQYGSLTLALRLALVSRNGHVTALVDSMNSTSLLLRNDVYKVYLSDYLHKPLKDFLSNALKQYNVSQVVFTSNMESDLGRYGDTLLSLGVVIVPVAYAPPPRLGERYALSFGGSFSVLVRAFSYEKAANLSDDEISRLLNTLTIQATIGNGTSTFMPTSVEGRTATFTITENADFGATALTIIPSKDWKGVLADVTINVSAFVLDKLKLLGNESAGKFALYSNITYPDIPRLYIKSVKFTKCPQTPKRAIIESTLANGLTYMLIVNKSLMSQYTLDNITYTYVIPRQYLLQHGVYIKSGDNWWFVLDYGGFNLLNPFNKPTYPVPIKPSNSTMADTAVTASFDSETKPSTLIVGIYSPVNQTVKVYAPYWIERLVVVNGMKKWETVERGNLTVGDEVAVKGGILTIKTYDVSNLTAKVIEIARKTNAMIRVRANVSTSVPDPNPGNNWGEAMAVITPEQCKRITGDSDTGTLNVTVVDALTNMPIVNATIVAVGNTTYTATTGTVV